MSQKQKQVSRCAWLCDAYLAPQPGKRQEEQEAEAVLGYGQFKANLAGM